MAPNPYLAAALGVTGTPPKKLAATARSQANADVGAIVAALKAQQAQAQQLAAQRANQISGASTAAAGYLDKLNLGGRLADTLAQASKDQAGLASGFSGQLQQDVGNAAAKTNAGLAAINAPGGPMANTSAAAGDTVYGLGGKIPANLLLTLAPAAVAAANARPAQILGAGQQASVGAIRQGAQQVAALNADIQNQTAKLPSLVSSYLSRLTTADQRAVNDAANRYLSAGRLDQSAQNADALNAYRQASLDSTNAYRQASLADRQAARAQAAAARSTRSSGSGISFIKDASGRTYVVNKTTGKVALAPGTLGQPRAGSGSSAKGAKPPTGSQLSGLVDSFYTGDTQNVRVPVVDSNKQPVVDANGVPRTQIQTKTVGQLTYQQAYKRLKALNVPEQQTLDLLNTKYQRGERGRPWLGAPERAVLAKVKGITPTAHYYKGHAYLDLAQVAVFKRDGGLPPGELVDGRYFIAPGY